MRKELRDEYVATSATASPTAATANTLRTSRARRESGLRTSGLSCFEHVSRLPNRLDQRRPRGVELPPQVADVRLDDVRVAAEVVAPDVLEDLALGENATWVQQEEAEQRELRRRQRDRRLAAEDLVPRLVQHDVGVTEHVAR